MYEVVGGNYFDKYGSKNPLHRRLILKFIDTARQCLRDARPSRIIDVGCGDGELANILFAGEPIDYIGFDVDPWHVERAQMRFPDLVFRVGAAEQLPVQDGSAELVLMSEVLEHLPNPPAAMQEAARVSSQFVLASVPWEPVWRCANMMRGAYLKEWGNTPGHIQHFSRRRFRSLVSRHFHLQSEYHPFPWTMILGTKHGTAHNSGNRESTK